MTDLQTILAVDDAPESLALLARVLEQAGYRVLPADSGELAITAAMAQPPDLVLLDVRMPGLNGLEVCQRLKEIKQTRPVPIILMSAHAETSDWVEGLRLGAADYICKPFQQEELLGRVRTHLALSRTQRLSQEAVGLRKAKAELEAEIRNRWQNEVEIERLNRLYQALSLVNKTVARTSTREELLAEVCAVLVRDGHLRMAWVGWEDPQTRAVTPLAHYGDSGGYLSQISVFADDRPEGYGPTGTALRESRTVVCNDFLSPETPAPWPQARVAKGFAAAAAFPIITQGLGRGVLSVYSSEKDFFRDKEVVLFEQAALDIAFALQYLEQRQQREQALAAYRESEKRFRSYFELPLIGIAITSPEKGWLEVNEHLCRALGYSQTQLRQMTWAQLTHPDDIEANVRNFNRVLAGEIEGYTMEKRFIRADGQVLPTELAVRCVRRPDGKVDYFVSLVQDITERKRMEEGLRQAQKMEAIGQLAGGVAHDFNNILAATILHLGLLKRNPSLDEATQRSLDELLEDSQRAANLTRQLLLFGRRSVMQAVPLSLNDLVVNLLKMLRRLLGEHIILRFDPRDGLPLVKADPGMLEQVVMNLCVNARDAIPKSGGAIMISLETLQVDESRTGKLSGVRPGQFVCLSVTDTGCGIDPATLEHIFEPFFTTKEVGKGTGLGLATVHGIAGQHGGWVEAESEPGQGTTFKVFLPASEEQINAPQPSANLLARGHETILLVEDERGLRRVAARSLRLLGYQIIEASDGQEAMQKWQEHHAAVDLLLSDMVMPGGLSGLDLVERLMAQKPSLKVIICTGYSAEMLLQAAPNGNSIIRLQKPYSMESLSQAIRQCLDSQNPPPAHR
jgi:PAS domain S-box-containing protein